MKAPLTAVATALLVACGTMPTDHTQTESVPYTFGRQISGGDFMHDPELARYVASIGHALSWDVVVLNRSAIESWALPEGKIAISRGQLLALTCETELVATLTTAMTHAIHSKDEDSTPGPQAPLVVGDAKDASRSIAQQLSMPAQKSRSTLRGCLTYQKATARLRAMSPAYEAYEAGVEALRRHELSAAADNAHRALALLPDEARIHELLGDIALEDGRSLEALTRYQQAIALDPNYYRPYAQAGSLLYRLGEDHRATQLLDRSMDLLPTAPAAYDLARIAHEAGDFEQEIQYYQLAASSDSPLGRTAARALVSMDLERNPSRYVDVHPRVDRAGHVWMEVRNHAPIPVDSVVVAAALVGIAGDLAEGPVRLSTGREALEPEGIAQLPTSLGPLPNPKAIRLVRAEVRAAEAVAR